MSLPQAVARTATRAARVIGIGAILVLLALGAGCDSGELGGLPPESDLFAYSLAVASRAQRLAPSVPALGVFNLGKVNERFGHEDRALELYADASQADPNFAEPFRSTGYILSQMKDRMSEAIESYQHALRCDPTIAGVLSRIALVFTHMGRLDDALLAINEEIRGGTANEDTYYNKGLVLALKNQHEEAVTAFREALRLAPGMRSSYYALGQSLRALGKNAEAEEADGKFRELKRAEDARQSVEDARAGSSNRQDLMRHAARTWLDAADLLAAESAAARNDRARLSALQTNYVTALNEACRLDPKNLEAWRLRIDYQMKAGNLQAATEACEAAAKAAPGESALAAMIFPVAGRYLEAQNGIPASADAVNAALRILELTLVARPDHPDAHREIAKVYLFRLRGRADVLPRALEHARAAVRAEGSAPNYDTLAYAFLQSGRPDLARGALEEGLQKNRDDPTLKDRLQKFVERYGGKPQ
jgi:tetratricopeptide (TPR) repeat protein